MVYRFAEAAFECRHSFDKPKELLEMYAIACWKEPKQHGPAPSVASKTKQPVVVRVQNGQAQHAYRTSIRRATYDENFEKAQHASSDNSVSADALTFGLVGK